MPSSRSLAQKGRGLDARDAVELARKARLGLCLVWWQGDEATTAGSYSVAEHTPHRLELAGEAEWRGEAGGRRPSS